MKKKKSFFSDNYFSFPLLAVFFIVVAVVVGFMSGGKNGNQGTWQQLVQLLKGSKKENLRRQSLVLDGICWKNLKKINIMRSDVFKKSRTLKKKNNESFFYFEYFVSLIKNISYAKLLKLLEESVAEVGGEVRKIVENNLGKNREKVVVDLAIYSNVTHRFIFILGKKKKRLYKDKWKPRIAILIDDVGYASDTMQTFFKMSPKITLSIIPGLHYSKREEQIAAANNQTIMLHLPLEPKHFSKSYKLKKGAKKERLIFTSDSEKNIKKKVNWFLDQIPRAVGVNNHMGSKFTENKAKLKTVLFEIKKRGLFFVDSLTSSHSKGKSLCLAMKIPFASRDVFIDYSDKPKNINHQLKKVLKKALNYGKVLAIGHPRPNTIKAVRRFVAQLPKDKFTLITVTEFVDEVSKYK